MYLLKVEHSFDSAHFLADYKGKCSNIHGHRWRIEVEIQTEVLMDEGEERGMITDFSNLKRVVREGIDYFDHALIVEEGTLRKETMQCLTEDGFRTIEVKFRPTAENFAFYFFKLIKDKGYWVRRVTVYETPTNSASYENNGGS